MLNKLEKRLKALADKKRLKIISLLAQKDFCVEALSEQLDISESSVSQHLKKLREAGLVMGEKKGYWVHYSLKIEELNDLTENIKNLTDYYTEDIDECCNHE